MGKNLDKLGKFDDYQAPWETETGETEIDTGKLKKFLFGLLSDKAKAQDARDETAEQLATTVTERDEARAEAEKGADPDLTKELEKARTKITEETARADKAERASLVTKVAIDKGIPLSQVHRLQGNTEEELAADADAFLKDFQPASAGDEDQGDEDNFLVSTPQRLRNPGEGNQQVGGTKAVDYDDIASQLISRNPF